MPTRNACPSGHDVNLAIAQRGNMSLDKRKGKSVSLAFNAGLPANPECLADQTVRLIRLEERYVKNIVVELQVVEREAHA